VADLLNHQVARKAVRRLDQDGPDAVALDALQHGREAGALVDMVRAAYGRVVELVHDHEARVPGEAGDSVSLALVAVLIGPDVCGAGGAQIRDRLDRFSRALAHVLP